MPAWPAASWPSPCSSPFRRRGGPGPAPEERALAPACQATPPAPCRAAMQDHGAAGMKSILIIGIGAGDRDYITVQAVKALNRVDVFFLMDKGPAKHKLRALREDLCRQHVKDRAYRFVEAPSPPRD